MSTSSTTHYDKLLKDLATVGRITRGVDPFECRTTLQDLKVQSYVFLAHAAFEEYLEQLCLDIATQSVRTYDQNGNISKSLVGLITCDVLLQFDEKSSRKKISENLISNISHFCSVAYGRFKSAVGDNNGITTIDQKRLLLPIGVDPEIEDSATMAALDSFGKKRGAIAHGVKIAKAHTLSEIQGDIETISIGLLNYDKACRSALAIRMIMAPS